MTIRYSINFLMVFLVSLFASLPIIRAESLVETRKSLTTEFQDKTYLITLGEASVLLGHWTELDNRKRIGDFRSVVYFGKRGNLFMYTFIQDGSRRFSAKYDKIQKRRWRVRKITSGGRWVIHGVDWRKLGPEFFRSQFVGNGDVYNLKSRNVGALKRKLGF